MKNYLMCKKHALLKKSRGKNPFVSLIDKIQSSSKLHLYITRRGQSLKMKDPEQFQDTESEDL